jgi:hypothetical protein
LSPVQSVPSFAAALGVAPGALSQGASRLARIRSQSNARRPATAFRRVNRRRQTESDASRCSDARHYLSLRTQIEFAHPVSAGSFRVGRVDPAPGQLRTSALPTSNSGICGPD